MKSSGSLTTKQRMKIKEGGGDGERRKETTGTPYWRKWMTPARCWAHTANLFRREAKGIQSFLEHATYTRKCRVSRIPQLWWNPHAMATMVVSD